jgi:sialidase-1
VTAILHSTTIVLGVYTATDSGSVPVTFDVPAGFELGGHTVEFVGVESGSVQVPFTVVDTRTPTVPGTTVSPSGQPTEPKAPTGGAASSDGHNVLPLLVAMGIMGAAGLGCLRLRKRVQ